MTVYYDVEVDNIFLQDVEFEGSISFEEAEYEDGYLISPDNTYCDDIDWDRSKYRFEENNTINFWLEGNYSKVEEKLINKYKNQE